MTSETIFAPLRDKPLRHLNMIAKRPTLNIEFQDLSYSIRDNSSKGGWRELLHSVNGTFRCGEVTAILGPSGAGKSTLLNMLAGCLTAGVQGSIKINDHPRDMNIFTKMSSYIMQEDVVQLCLTVKESMIYAANLKLGSDIKRKDKAAVVDEVLQLLGLESCQSTMTQHLSGGQRKRLSVALELVNNPPVIFLDEPTTGLDNVSIKQCIDLLKKISHLDRTVICTIHQPPASLFQCFDQVYILADGFCVYNGSPAQLVPQMSLAGFACPENYTPADYMIELVHSKPLIVQAFCTSIQNGKINMKQTLEQETITDLCEDDGIYCETSLPVIEKDHLEFATSFSVQFGFLLSRMWLQMMRSKTTIYIWLFHHVLLGVLIGAVYYDSGSDASKIIATFKYCVTCVVFFMYTHVFIPVLLFPMEVELLRRELFNRWYGLGPYYLAQMVATFPVLASFGLLFSAIVYILAGQPMELHRFIQFCVMGLAVSLASQSLGYVIGTIFNVTKGAVVASAVLAPLLCLGVYGMGYRDAIEPFYKFAMTLSYLRYGIMGYCNTLFYQRQPLECDEFYCHYDRPAVLMRDLAVPLDGFSFHVIMVFVFMFIFRLIAYFALRLRFNTELSSRIASYVTKVVRHKW